MRKLFFAFVIISVLANLYMYGRCWKTSSMNAYLFDDIDYKRDKIEELEKENECLKAEIVILSRSKVSHENEYLNNLPYVIR